ncbi:predicted protein [Aspergillus terreus NIH2624]|uniref:Uncharacterized protein n=1 Tax=Aspergillus terreus (strain NIH 2624 / FGSC A1156) TaxID=341663 RepID=Q0CK99_ASPTN|nr:uncharacterized protein ATEG_05885 [Aspergillus terreus NIH2624]EAU33646.1 predicted protein [Aspergillus terreus NIH2624]
MASQLLVWGFCSGLLRPSPVGHLAVAGPDLRSAGGSLLPPMNDLRPARTPTRVSSGPFFPSSAATDSPIMSCTSTPLSDEAPWPWAESALHRAFVYLCLVCTKRDDMYGKDGYPDDNNHEIAQSSFKALMEPLDINRSYAHILRTYYQPYKPAHLLLLVSTIMIEPGRSYDTTMTHTEYPHIHRWICFSLLITRRSAPKHTDRARVVEVR